MSLSRESAAAFVASYGRAWERWDVAGFTSLFSDDVVYVAHPTDETVIGSQALAVYVRKEQEEQGSVRVLMGTPIVDGDQLVAEFWVTATTSTDQKLTIPGCIIARIDPRDGRCGHFREYWFDVEGHTDPFPGWGA
ncbi:MAG: nuclear transport factor 2 family protein [Solirubrobacteraceae bacterium]